jgi:hypothetical protein
MNKKKEMDFKNNQNLKTSLAAEKNSPIKEKQQQLPPGKDEKWWGK